ncbi:MAG: FG-GAP-like repeat-containing protein [Planctomycetota bacterium]
MHAKLRRLGLLLPLLAAPIASQFVPYYGPEVRTPWPATAGRTGSFTRCAAGNLTGHHWPDAILLECGRPFLMAVPGFHSSLAPLPGWTQGPVTDAITLRRQQGRDFVALSNAAGLWIWRLGDGEPLVTHADAARFDTATLAAVDLDGDGDDDVVGANGDSLAILTIENEASFEQPLEMSMGSTILAITGIQWDAEPGDEIAVITRAGLTILSADLEDVLQYPWPADAGFATRVAAPGAPTGELLAWCGRRSPNETVLFIASATTGQAVSLDGLPVVAIAAGDCTSDGHDDLILSHSASHKAQILVNQGTGAALGAFRYDTLGVIEAALIPGAAAASQPAPNNVVHPAVADLDGDGDADVVWPVESTSEIVVGRNPFIDERTQRVDLDLFAYSPIDIVYGLSAAPETEVFVRLRQAPLPAGATHVELLAWEATLEPTASNPLVLNPRAAAAAPLPAQGTMPPGAIQALLPAGALHSQTVSTFLLVLRAVELDAAGTVVRAFPGNPYYVTTAINEERAFPGPRVAQALINHGAVVPGGIVIPPPLPLPPVHDDPPIID